MLKRLISQPAVALALALAPAALGAQAAAPVTPASWTVSGAFGGLSGAANLDQAGTADWRLGWAPSLNATGWVHENYSVRAGAGWGQDSSRDTTGARRVKPN